MENTQEGNRLIAEFMGWESGRYSHLPNRLHRTDDKNVEWSTDINNLMYHQSWDWLMPVYQKVANVWFNLSPKKQKEVKDIKEALQNRLVLAELNSVWEFIVQFIQWHNTHKPQPNATK